MIQKDDDRHAEALEIYDRVLNIAPSQRLYALHRAQLLFTMEQYDLVVDILKEEVQNARSESSVYFLLGKAHAKLGNTQDAVMAMTLAQDTIEHKSSSIIKEAIGLLQR